MIDAAIVRLLLEASLRVLIVAAAVGGVLAIARVKKGSVRHWAWTLVVIAMLLMPALVFVVPQIELPRASRGSALIPDTAEIPYIGDVDFDQRVGGQSGGAPAAAAANAATEAPTQPSAGNAPIAPSGIPLWMVALVAIYAAGLLMLLIRWVRAARFLSALRKTCRPIDPAEIGAASARVYESHIAATPITVGAFTPWIVLPASWRTWTPEKRAAVLAHERSHVRRRDPLIGLVAYLNRCIYWFNPLAWWLERQVAAAAEHAADEDGVRAIGEERVYAGVLLDMAAIVRANGGRVAWQGVGVDGNGLLGNRIDRVLSGAFLQEVSRMKQRTVLFVAILAIVVAAACKRHVEPPDLQPNPDVVARNAEQKLQNDRVKAANELTPAELADLKSRLVKNPDDFDALEKVLIYYRGEWTKEQPPPSEAAARLAARRPYILDLIKRHPEHNLAGSWYIRLYPAPTDPLSDPEGYAKAKALWLGHAAKPDVPVVVLKHAADFFEAYDPALSETMLLKAQAKEASPAISAQLGRLYGIVASGTYAATPLNVPRYADKAHALSAYAQSVRAKLDASTDSTLLAAACGWMLRNSHGEVGVDVKLLGRQYCERAVTLGPNPSAAEMLAREDDIAAHQYITDKFKGLSIEQRIAAVDEFPEAQRLMPLLEMAERAYEISRDGKDTAAASIRMANEALTLAEKPENAKLRGSALYRANMVLGANAMRRGDRSAAVTYLLTAADAPPARATAFDGFGAENDLVNYLLKYGERESIIQFYEKAATRGTRDHQYYLDSAKAVRAGQMPMRYQYYFQSALTKPATSK